MEIVTVEGRDWKSSLIKQTEYTPDSKQLCIVFHNDAQYLYEEVTEEEYKEFCAADSQGAFFSKNFRTKKFVKIETLTDEPGNQEG